MAINLNFKLEPWVTYKISTGGTELFIFNVPTAYSFVKYGRTDYVGKVPTHNLERGVKERGDKLEEWPESDDVFNDYYIKIFDDIFKATEYYVKGS